MPDLVRYDGTMIIPEEELPDVDEAARKVVQEAEDTPAPGSFGEQLESQSGRASLPPTERSPIARTGDQEVIGGFAVIDMPSREDALEWAARIAVACRCAQEVREIMPDPNV